ncbi:MAG: hypothetical protein RL588_2310 [Pseudomonadota bacterium]
MKFRFLPTALFVSLAFNLFLVGVLAGGWREIRSLPAPPPIPAPPQDPAAPSAGPEGGAEISAPPLAVPRPTVAREAAPVAARAPEPRSVTTGPPAPRAPDPAPPEFGPPPPGPERSRGPGDSPLMRAARDLPDPERLALQTLLRAESEAVRADLQQARRERAAAWRALARGEIGEAEAGRRLDQSRRRELAARSRVENAVADWASRQSPEVRIRLGEALAEDAQPPRRRPVRPPGWPGPPPGSGPGRAEGS